MDDQSCEEIAWAAGLFEGEGSMSVRSNHGVNLYLGMTDEDTVRRFHSVMGAGQVYTKRRARAHYKILYAWHCDRSADVTRILNLFFPWFGERRRERAAEMFERLAKNPGPKAEWTHCPNGHPFVGVHLYVHKKTGKRMCRTCATERRRRWVAKQRAAVS